MLLFSIVCQNESKIGGTFRQLGNGALGTFLFALVPPKWSTVCNAILLRTNQRKSYKNLIRLSMQPSEEFWDFDSRYFLTPKLVDPTFCSAALTALKKKLASGLLQWGKLICVWLPIAFQKKQPSRQLSYFEQSSWELLSGEDPRA